MKKDKTYSQYQVMMQLIPYFLSSEEPMIEFGNFFKDFIAEQSSNNDA